MSTKEFIDTDGWGERRFVALGGHGAEAVGERLEAIGGLQIWFSLCVIMWDLT